MTNWATSSPPLKFQPDAVRAGGDVERDVSAEGSLPEAVHHGYSKSRNLVGGGVRASLREGGAGRASLADTSGNVVVDVGGGFSIGRMSMA